MGHYRSERRSAMLKTMFFRGLTVGLLLLATAVHGAPVTFELQGAAMDLQFPSEPLTTAEAQELVRKFTGQASLTLVYDAAAATSSGGGFHYAPMSGPVFVLTVTNATGTSTYSFSEYRAFLDDQSFLDTMVFTPFLAEEASVTLSTGTTVGVDIGLILQDATGTTLTSGTALPATLDFTKLNIRGYSFVFIMQDDSGNGSVKGALALPTAVCGNGTVETGEDCDDGDMQNGDCCSSTCQFESSGASCGDAGSACVNQDTCDGAGTCTDNGFKSSGTSCGDPTNTACDDPDTCDGAGMCQTNTVTCGGMNATICGDAGNNVLTGTNSPNVIHGLGGDDTIRGRGGNDKICGGSGNDSLRGDTGNDTLDGGDHTTGDTCNGGPGSGDTATNCETVTKVP